MEQNIKLSRKLLPALKQTDRKENCDLSNDSLNNKHNVQGVAKIMNFRFVIEVGTLNTWIS